MKAKKRKATNRISIERGRGVVAGTRRPSELSDMDKYAQMRQKTMKGKVKER